MQVSDVTWGSAISHRYIVVEEATSLAPVSRFLKLLRISWAVYSWNATAAQHVLERRSSRTMSAKRPVASQYSRAALRDGFRRSCRTDLEKNS